MKPVPKTLHLSIGELIVSSEPAVISTVLGSCVSVCLFSRAHGIGGMIHYALPNAPSAVMHEESFRYGDLAIPSLIEELVRLTGEDPSHFEAKLAGGAAEINGQVLNIQAGPVNIKIAKEILAHYRIRIIGESVGGSLGRKVLFHTGSGRLQVADMNKTGVSLHPQATRPRKVLIVDDSKTIRDLIQRILQEDPDLQIIGQAQDVFEAEKILQRERPDVITLDIHMPKMTGVEWLEKIMPLRALPVVMISSLQMQEGNEVFRALELGAIDYIQKPTLSELKTAGPIIREKVKAASYAKVIQHKQKVAHKAFSGEIDMRMVLAIGASTGGTEALKSVISAFPERIPPTVIVQHIPPVFSKAFADRLNDLCPFEVKEAEDGDELKPSRVLIAPGGRQMQLVRKTTGLFVRITDDAPVNRHKPSVDYLFRSVASLVGNRAVGVILTGMGADGAKGLLEMKNKGAHTIGQDEESCVVYGMPKVAFDIGAVLQVASLSKIPNAILRSLERKKAS